MATELNLITLFGQPDFLLDLMIKSTAILVAAFLITRLLRQASASVRHSVWGVALLAVLALPVINVCLPKWTMGAFSQPQANAANQIPSLPATEPVDYPAQSALTSVSARLPQIPSAAALAAQNRVQRSDSVVTISNLSQSMQWLSLCWLTGVALMCLRLAMMPVRLWSVRRQCEMVSEGRLFELLQTCRETLGCAQPVTLLVKEEWTMPMTWGMLRASILLPREAEQWSEQDVRCALLHELAHVSRRDCLLQLFVQLTCAVYWFNPLVWFAARCVYFERERACDDIVLQNGTRASDYADQLLQVVSRFQASRRLKYLAVSMASRNGFAERLQAILQETQDRRPVRLRTMVTLAITFIGLTGLLGVFQVAFNGSAYAQQRSTNQAAEQQSNPESLKQTSQAKPPVTKDAPSVAVKPVPSALLNSQNSQLPKQVSRQESLPLQPKRNELKPLPDASVPGTLKNGAHPDLSQNRNRPAVRSLNIVFAHDPGLGNYDGIVGRPSDVWNSVDIGTTAVDYMRYSDATPSTARLRVTRHDGEWGIQGQSGIFHGYIYHNCRCVDLETKVLDLPAGKYKIYVFAHGDAPDQHAEIELKVGKRVVGKKATANDDTWEYRTQPYREGLQYVSFNFKKRAGEEVTLISHRGPSGYSMFNAIQIVPLTEAGK
ncbi:M56 family metallopeptidase [Gimesia algae]|uniref:Regulatory protein BlaR1 n=1 Tax=Gimesia algae TaxID=2527971 RepID=A0A517VB98_9PLAN|nr:M56 family metallopeptidase [Gimesia algae]QDT90274.1 Regulatory protein BlaR1 [Gimesia algae]